MLDIILDDCKWEWELWEAIQISPLNEWIWRLISYVYVDTSMSYVSVQDCWGGIGMADMYIIHQPEKILCDLKRSFSFSNLSRSYTDKFFFKKKRQKKHSIVQYIRTYYRIPVPSSWQLRTVLYVYIHIVRLWLWLWAAAPQQEGRQAVAVPAVPAVPQWKADVRERYL